MPIYTINPTIRTDDGPTFSVDPPINRKPLIPSSWWDKLFETTYARPPMDWTPSVENFWSRLARGEQEATSAFYNWLAAYVAPFTTGEDRRALTDSVVTYGPPELRQHVLKYEKTPLFDRTPSFGWHNWNWDTSDVRWRAFLEGLQKAREKFSSMIDTEKPPEPKTEMEKKLQEELKPWANLPQPAEAAFNWLERLAKWGEDYEIDPLDINNRYRHNRWKRMQAARELEHLFSVAPSEEVAKIGRRMVGSHYGLPQGQASDQTFGYQRMNTTGTPFAWRNLSFM